MNNAARHIVGGTLSVASTLFLLFFLLPLNVPGTGAAYTEVVSPFVAGTAGGFVAALFAPREKLRFAGFCGFASFVLVMLFSPHMVTEFRWGFAAIFFAFYLGAFFARGLWVAPVEQHGA